MTKWKKFLAVSCSHGHLADPRACKATIDFKARWKPDITLHLGDLLDMAALRGGALKSPDSADRATSISDDFSVGIKFLLELAPNVLTLGNHDWRLWELAKSPNAIVSYCCNQAIGQLNDACREIKCVMKPYDIEKGWVELGPALAGHGFMHSEQAVRDHAELTKKTTIIGHLHRVDRAAGRSFGAPVGWCIGSLANFGEMHYARRNRSLMRWAQGICWGEFNDKNIQINVLTPNHDGTWRLPV